MNNYNACFFRLVRRLSYWSLSRTTEAAARSLARAVLCFTVFWQSYSFAFPWHLCTAFGHGSRTNWVWVSKCERSGEMDYEYKQNRKMARLSTWVTANSAHMFFLYYWSPCQSRKMQERVVENQELELVDAHNQYYFEDEKPRLYPLNGKPPPMRIDVPPRLQPLPHEPVSYLCVKWKISS